MSATDNSLSGLSDGVDIHDASGFTKYISAIHFATTTMATVRAAPTSLVLEHTLWSSFGDMKGLESKTVMPVFERNTNKTKQSRTR